MPSRAPSQKRNLTVAGVLEWVVVTITLAAAVFAFLNFNGFIDTSDIHPYPF